MRGQAMIETVITVPLLLLAMFGLLWLGQLAVSQERVAVSARYAAFIGNQTTPYQNYSIADAYAYMMGVSSTPASGCLAADGTLESIARNVANNDGVSQPVTKFFFTDYTDTCTLLGTNPIATTTEIPVTALVSVNTITGSTSAATFANMMYSGFGSLVDTAFQFQTETFQPLDVYHLVQCQDNINAFYLGAINPNLDTYWNPPYSSATRMTVYNIATSNGGNYGGTFGYYDTNDTETLTAHEQNPTNGGMGGQDWFTSNNCGGVNSGGGAPQSSAVYPAQLTSNSGG